MQSAIKKIQPAYPETAEAVLAGFDAWMPKDDPDWLRDLRLMGRDYIAHHGLPTPKVEGWKFTNLIPQTKQYGPINGRTKVSSNKPDGVFSQGLVAAVREHDWVREMIAEDAHYTDHNTDPAMWHLSNMFFRDGVAIDVEAGVNVVAPMEILLVCDEENALYNVHTAIRIGANASLTIVEDHRGTGTFWKNRLSHIRLGPGARLTHIRLQHDSHAAVYTQTTKIEIAKDAHYEAVGLYTGARLSRNQVHAVLQGPGATAHINGINLMRGEQHTDTTILIEHRAPNCASRQNFRSVLDDRAHGVFQGKVHVHQPAQKTDGYQLSKAILLSEGAEMDTKPELEIYADDVKCSHGATTGQLDEEPIFYMRSRGIDEESARALMIESFCADALETVDDDALKDRLMAEVREWLV